MKEKLRYERKISRTDIAVEYIQLILGCFITAVAFNIFLGPNQIASGGVAGTSIIIEYLFGIQPAFTQWGLNIPLFFLGLMIFGKKFGLRTAIGTIILPLFIFITKDIGIITKDLILSALFGGIGVGIGLGITFRAKASTGGFSIVASIIHKYTGISIGKCSMMLDALVIIGASFAFNAEKGLYALVSLYVTGKAIDIVQMDFNFSKVAFVISENNEQISKSILTEIDRGVTRLFGTGGFTGNEKSVLMVVMGQSEVNRFKEMVKGYDPSAFIIMCDTHEVLGKGFKLQSVNQQLGKNK